MFRKIGTVLDGQGVRNWKIENQDGTVVITGEYSERNGNNLIEPIETVMKGNLYSIACYSVGFKLYLEPMEYKHVFNGYALCGGVRQ